jgi:DNA-binding transcriptional LysR family regulator
VSLRSVNLNLVPILQALLQEKNVSRAATRLGITQSAASKALAQLRQILSDPLLIRVGNRLVASQRAQDILVEVDEALRRISNVLDLSNFNPILSERHFTITCVDYVALLIMTRLDGVLSREAPKVTLSFVDLPLSGAWGHVDFVVAPREFVAALNVPDANSATLFRDKMVSISKSGDHGTRSPLDGAAAQELIKVDRVGGSIIDFDADQPYRPKLTKVARYSVQQFAPLAYFTLLTGAKTEVPKLFLELLRLELPLEESPADSSWPDLEFMLAWRSALAKDPAHRWLKGILVNAFSSKAAPNN